VIDLHAISIEGYIFLGAVFFLACLYIEWRILTFMFKTALKSAIDEISEQYRKALEEYKRRHRVG